MQTPILSLLLVGLAGALLISVAIDGADQWTLGGTAALWLALLATWRTRGRR